MPNSVAKVLTIAGSDSCGGAGLQADIKTFNALGVYGMTAMTSVTVQNTTGVFEVHDIPPQTVAHQIDVVAADMGVDAAKTGMLSNVSIIEAVAASIENNNIQKLIVDPVMVATSGAALIDEDAKDTLISRLLPLALLVTPNLHEAQSLASMTIDSEADVAKAGARILELGPKNVLIKGGHLESEKVTDFLFHDGALQTFAASRIQTIEMHGTGCTLSAALAAYLAKDWSMEEALAAAKEYVTGAIRHGWPLGHGTGSLNHFWNLGR